MTGVDVLDSNYLLITLIVTAGMQYSFFAIAYTCEFDKVTDIAGTMNFVILALLTLLLRQTFYARQMCAASSASRLPDLAQISAA